MTRPAARDLVRIGWYDASASPTFSTTHTAGAVPVYASLDPSPPPDPNPHPRPHFDPADGVPA